ncbi:MAG: hypothetical protein PSX81_03060 [bacterium]|nr:hypothetical protein [bacterium]
MKKILLIIGITLIAFITFGLYKASGLKSIEIVTTTTIKGSKQEVFDMVKYLNNFPKWSPFLVQDPTQKHDIKGTDGTVGAQYHWIGNKGEDVGYQEIAKIDELNFIGKKCDIQKPFVAKPTFEYYFTENSNGIEVKEVFKLESGLMDAFFLWVFGAKAEMEKTNQQGLDLLNKAVTIKN